jgi:hypothetical protein
MQRAGQGLYLPLPGVSGNAMDSRAMEVEHFTLLPRFQCAVCEHDLGEVLYLLLECEASIYAVTIASSHGCSRNSDCANLEHCISFHSVA